MLLAVGAKTSNLNYPLHNQQRLYVTCLLPLTWVSLFVCGRCAVYFYRSYVFAVLKVKDKQFALSSSNLPTGYVSCLLPLTCDLVHVSCSGADPRQQEQLHPVLQQPGLAGQQAGETGVFLRYHDTAMTRV